MIDINTIGEALDYFGMIPTIMEWEDLCAVDGHVSCPLSYKSDDLDLFIWSVFVLEYGNYGTSPRFGWIEDVDGFRNCISKIREAFC